ncbi:MAG: hypothetical protein V7784_07765 [Oceanospirillaceae bacterium]
MLSFNHNAIYLDQLQSAQDDTAQMIMLGHCPGAVDLAYLFNTPPIVAQIAQLGFEKRLAVINNVLKAALKARLEGNVEEEQDHRHWLYGLPIPIYSLQQFQKIFTHTQEPTLYQTALAGDQAWLPLAVEDFFQAPTETANIETNHKLWIVSVDQNLAQAGFLPQLGDDVLDSDNRGFHSSLHNALSVQSAALMAMPDLERLQISSMLRKIPRMRLANIAPQFLPCSFDYQDNHRERRYFKVTPTQPAPFHFTDIVVPVLQKIAALRADIHWIYSMPFADDREDQQLKMSQTAQHAISELQTDAMASELHRVQLIYPYLQSQSGQLRSASAMIAKKMLSTSARLGAWRSIAGMALGIGFKTFPDMQQNPALINAKTLGIGLLNFTEGRLSLDSERLSAGVLQQNTLSSRRGEIARFIGWLRRNLENLGLDFIFQSDPQDPRPLMILNKFFNDLYTAGALQGANAEQAFNIEQQYSEDKMIFEILFAPAFAIESIKLNLTDNKLEALSQGGFNQGTRNKGVSNA